MSRAPQLRPVQGPSGGFRLSRRSALKVMAAAVALPAGALGLRAFGEGIVPVQWSGTSLGAQASMTLWHPNPDFARSTLARMRTEVERLDCVFSLYRADSEIARINRAGRVHRPSRDLLLVLDEAKKIASLSGGAFDPTIQPLWNAYAAHFSSQPLPTAPFEAALAHAAALVDHSAVAAERREIVLEKPGMALSLNGIAQGYVTDRIADLLRNEGFEHAMVELGETRAVGAAADGRPFEVALANPARPGIVDRTVQLADMALSVSGGYGLRFGTGSAHHIFDPATGHSAEKLLDVTVLAPRATCADALSTAICVTGEVGAATLLQAYPGARALVTRLDGSSAWL